MRPENSRFRDEGFERLDESMGADDVDNEVSQDRDEAVAKATRCVSRGRRRKVISLVSGRNRRP